MKKLFIISTSFIGFFFVNTAFAQEDLGLPDENVEVVKQFEPNISDAIMFDYFPQRVKEESLPPLNLNYKLDDKTYDIDYPAPQIKPLAYDEEKELHRQNGYLKAGYGNLHSPLVEGQFHYEIPDWFEAGLNVRHLSAKEDRTVYEEIMADTYTQLYGAYFLGAKTKLSADGSVRFEDRNLHRLIFNEETSVEKIDINNYDANIHFDHNNFAEKGFSTKQNVGYYSSNSGLYDVTEWALRYSSHTNKRIGDTFLVFIDLETERYASDSLNHWFYQAQLGGDFKIGPVDVRMAGLVAKPDSNYVIRPQVKLGYHLNNLPIGIETGYASVFRRNSLQRMLSENSFYYRPDEFFTSFQTTDQFYLSANYYKGDHDLKVSLVYEINKNHPLFVATMQGQFTHIESDFNAFSVSLIGRYDLLSWLKIHPVLEYKHYHNNEEEFVASFLPAFTGALKLEQHILDNRISIYQKATIYSARDFLDLEMNDVNLPSFIDLGLGGEFTVFKNFKAFVDVNNILNQRYQIWNDYPVFGTQIHAGAKVIF